MKKLFFCLAAVALFAGCKDDSPELSVNQTEFTIPPTGEQFEFKVEGNTPWTVTGQEGEEEWLFVGPAAGSGEGIVFLEAFENVSFKPRNARLTLTAEGAPPVTVEVTQNGIPSDLARIEIVVKADWWANVFGRCGGMQLLADSNHDTYSRVFPKSSQGFPVLTGAWKEKADAAYNEFEYKIPATANASNTAANILVKGQRSAMLLPAGIYDYAIVFTNDLLQRPMLTGTTGNLALGDDYEFKGGWFYTFTIDVDPYAGGAWGEGVPIITLDAKNMLE